LTGKFDLATQVTLLTFSPENDLTRYDASIIDKLFGLLPSSSDFYDACIIAKALGLTTMQMTSEKGFVLWTGEHFRMRYIPDPSGESDSAMICIKTDKDQEDTMGAPWDKW
jgi:hypothetical protein